MTKSTLPAPLQAHQEVVLAKMRHASTRPELEAAKRDGEALVRDIASHEIFKAILDPSRARPMGMGGFGLR